MRRATLYRRSLSYHWRTNLAVVLGAAVATAALTGALIVGDSMRASLLEIALGRLGRIDDALVAPRFFPADLAGRVSADQAYAQRFDPVVPVILMQGAATHADSRARAGGISIVGVDDRFWGLSADVRGRSALDRRDSSASDSASNAGRAVAAESEPRPSGSGPPQPQSPTHANEPQIAPTTSDDRTVILNDALANELAARVGDDILLRLPRPSAISTETLLGRRDESAAAVRLTVSKIVPARGLGAFSVDSRQVSPKNAFVPLATLQRALKNEGGANALLIATASTSRTAGDRSAPDAPFLQQTIDHHLTLADLGLELRVGSKQGYVALESDAILLSPPVEDAAVAAAKSINAVASPILTHLANSIRKQGPAASGAEPADGASSIPYSTIAAVGASSATAAQLAKLTVEGEPLAGPGDLLLNRWAADDLAAKVGNRIEVTYYISGPLGRLETRSTLFTLRGVVAMEGAAIDPGFIPDYPGVTDTQNLSDWNPPFPVDLKRVRDKDEKYWDDYRTAPKAFITLEEGQQLWASEGERLGQLTSIRIRLGEAADQAPSVDELQGLSTRFQAALLDKISPVDVGLTVRPIRANALSASRGSTDFGGLFIGFSFFLIAAAAMLVGLLFRLGIERRATEIGTMLAIGFAPRTLTFNLVAEGLMLSAIGGVVGLAAANGYAWLMLAGLRSWWSSAVNSPFLELHASATSYAIGFFASVFVAGGSAGWAVRGLTRRSPRNLLAGAVESARIGRRNFGLDFALAIAGFGLAAIFAITAAATNAMSPVLAFFFAGACVLIGAMAAFGRWLRRPAAALLHVPGPGAIVRLAIRNAPRHRGRSMLTASLIASATFVIVALEAFHLDAGGDVQDKSSGTGGFTVFAESAVPLPYDLNTPEGRRSLGIDELPVGRDQGIEGSREQDQVPIGEVEAKGEDAQPGFAAYSFRLRPGDESSCLNLYVPVQPRVIGAPASFIERGGFAFSGSTAETEIERANPWRLLDKNLAADVIPAIGDEAAVLWQLHSGLGQDFTISDERGRSVQLRFVALLKGSVLQDEIVISETNLTRLFPGIEGHSFFLVETPTNQAERVERSLEKDLERFGLDAGSTATRLAAYNAVQNTYLSTFQTLGGLGLILGTFGLAAILLRNVWERRRELALMRATGFTRGSLAATVMSENLLLVAVGLVSGSLAAAIAVAPRLASQPESVPVASLALLLLLVLAAGVLSASLGILSTLRLNLVASLRAE